MGRRKDEQTSSEKIGRRDCFQVVRNQSKTEIMKGKVKDSTQQNYESQLAGSLLSANQVSIRGSGQREPFCRYSLQSRVGRWVSFPCYVAGGNSVTFGLHSPLVRLWEGYE